jgi:hypothetical protein
MHTFIEVFTRSTELFLAHVDSQHPPPNVCSLQLTECDSLTPNSFGRRWAHYVGRIGTIWGSTVGSMRVGPS